MYVFTNPDQELHLVDYKTLEIIRQIPLEVPEEMWFFGMDVTADNSHLIFGLQGSGSNGFSTYDIEQEEFATRFFTGKESSGPMRFTSAQNQSEPGLVYAHLRDYGTVLVDVLEAEFKKTISLEHDFTMSKTLTVSPERKWVVIKENLEADGSFSKLEFYDPVSGLTNLEFALNENDRDGIYIYDLKFSNDAARLFISYQLSDNRSREVESYFGSYDLQSKELYPDPLILPWSLNPYYMEYSSMRDEVYLIGAYQDFYIINAQTHQVERTVNLPDKVPGPSQIILSPDGSKAFVSCADSNLIYVIDLETRETVGKIEFESFRPYAMIIP